MEEQAEKLMIENLSKNMSDADEYVFSCPHYETSPSNDHVDIPR